MSEAASQEGQRELWRDMHRKMLLIRHFEESVRTLASSGAVPGLVHLCAGQEATNVGVISALVADDYIASHHRGHGHCLAKGADVTGLMLEILGKANGLCGGRSGSMHVIDLDNRNLGANGIVGGGIPLAAGAALAIRARGEWAVSVCFFGDGALNQGLLHECMNMAAIWRLPVVFVCENNGYGEFTAMEDVTAGKDLLARGVAFDIPSRMIDGMDVHAVHAGSSEAVARARNGEGPSFLVCNTWRFGGHHVGDRQDYKDDAQTLAWCARDPIPRSARALMAAGYADADDIARMEVDVVVQVKHATEIARAAPEPDRAALMEHVLG